MLQASKSIKRKKQAGGKAHLVVLNIGILLFYFGYARYCLFYRFSFSDMPLIRIVHLAVFHAHFALFYWSIAMVVWHPPGDVPQFWGFYVGDEPRRKRYCRVCEVWKPDRTHHCSACQKCVINMDHHCPWINNCVGFYNRKYFIQALLYGNICVMSAIAHNVCLLLPVFMNSSTYSGEWIERDEPVSYGIRLIILTASIVLVLGLIPFTRFHWHLLISNSTTIEALDANFNEHARFNLGVRRNIEQVFGVNPWLWWLPMHVKHSHPVGDGVRWRRHYLLNTDTSTM